MQRNFSRINIDGIADIDTGEVALHIAVRLGKFDIVQLILQKASAVNAVDKQGQSPLHMASSREMVLTLVEYMADCFLFDKFGRSALDLAVWRKGFDLRWALAFCSPSAYLRLLRVRRKQDPNSSSLQVVQWVADPPKCSTDALLVVAYLLDVYPSRHNRSISIQEVLYPRYTGSLEAARLFSIFALENNFTIDIETGAKTPSLEKK